MKLYLTAPKGGSPKFRAVQPSPTTSFALFASLWVSFVNFGGVEAGAVKCARLEFSGCRVRGVEGSRIPKHHQDSTKTPREDTERAKWCRERVVQGSPCQQQPQQTPNRTSGAPKGAAFLPRFRVLVLGSGFVCSVCLAKTRKH